MANVCGECGLIHPPAATGQCPVAREQKFENDLKAKEKGILMDSLLTIKEDFLKKLKDASETEIKRTTAKIRNIIFNYKNN